MPAVDLRKELKFDTKRGVWWMRPYLGTNAVTRKPIKPYHSWHAESEEEALALAQAWLNTIAAAADMHVSQRLDQLLSRYIDTLVAARVSPNTVKTYRSALAPLRRTLHRGERPQRPSPLRHRGPLQRASAPRRAARRRHQLVNGAEDATGSFAAAGSGSAPRARPHRTRFCP